MPPLIMLSMTPQAAVHLAREFPFLWFLAGLALAWLPAAALSRFAPESRRAWLRRVGLGAGVLVLLLFVAACLYSLRCYMLQADEANILGIAAQSLHGPMFLPPDSPDANYSLIYGPVLFVIYRIGLMAGGVDHFWVMRGLIVLADFGVAAALYLLLRRFVSAAAAVMLLALPLSALLQHTEGSLAIRADIWIVLFATLAVYGSFLESELAALLLVGIMGGVLVCLKITAGSAILFPLLILYRRFGVRPVLVASLVAAITALLPFALPGISLHNYVAWILFTRSEGMNPRLAFVNMMFGFFLIAPCVAMELFMRPSRPAFRNRLPAFLLIAVCLAVAVLTSKPGAGPWYLWHIIPSIVAYMGLASRSEAAGAGERLALAVYSVAVGCALVTCVNLPRSYAYLKASRMPAQVALAHQSVARYLDAYKDRSSVQMGYGSVGDDISTSVRYVLVYKGEPYTVEGNTGRFDTLLLPFPANVLKHMETCKDDVWLVPHGQRPFGTYIFPQSLRSTFAENYRVDRSDSVFDAWTCRHGDAPAGTP